MVHTASSGGITDRGTAEHQLAAGFWVISVSAQSIAAAAGRTRRTPSPAAARVAVAVSSSSVSSDSSSTCGERDAAVKFNALPGGGHGTSGYRPPR